MCAFVGALAHVRMSVFARVCVRLCVCVCVHVYVCV